MDALFTRTNLTYGLWSLLALFALHWSYFLFFPQRAINKYHEQKSDPERLRRYLEWIVATPSLLGSSFKVAARLGLAGIHAERLEYPEAINHCRKILQCLCKSEYAFHDAALFPETRRQLADYLEAIGEVQAAAVERARAAEELERIPADPQRHLTRGKLLERQNRHEEAYAEFQRALNQAPPRNLHARSLCLSHLTIAAFNRGRPVECVQAAEAIIALGPKGSFLFLAHKMAGIACGNLSRLDEGEQHFRMAFAAAEAERNRPVMAETLALLADCLRKRGRLAEAYDTSVRAAAIHPNGERMSQLVQASVFQQWGRYDEALAIRTKFRGIKQKLHIPSLEQRTQAAVALDTARHEAECGRADDAWIHIQEALVVLKNDAKLGLKCGAALSLVMAARGMADESKRIATEIESRLGQFERDPSTCRGILYDLGMGACTRGDHSAGIDSWTRYLALGPDPVYMPTAFFYRGECHRELGQLSAARQDYQAAIELDIDTHHARNARQQLTRTSLSGL